MPRCAGPHASTRRSDTWPLHVNVLFGALLVATGSTASTWLSVMGQLGSGTEWFWLGHGAYEDIDLGRLWHILLLVALFLVNAFTVVLVRGVPCPS